MKIIALLIGVLVSLSVGLADAQTPLRQSTSRVVRICGVVAVGDGFTPVTTLSLSGADEAEALRDNTATLDISGATFAAITGADGCYSLTLDTTATNTVGELIVQINDDSLILPVWRTFQVLEEVVFDRDYAANATGNTALVAQGIPNAVPGAAGGLFIAGTNAATAISTSLTLGSLVNSGVWTQTGNMALAAGLNITQSSSNTAALVVTGNGTGNGATISSGGGATGTGLAVLSAATNGAGATITGTGTGNGATFQGGATGAGLSALGGATSGAGINAQATTSGSGLIASGANNGSGIAATAGASGSGSGIIALTTTGGTGNGFTAQATANNGNGISAIGFGTGSGLIGTAGATGDGIEGIGGATSGAGARYAGTAGNSPAATFVGQGSAAGALFTGGATGAGASYVGGATSGVGLLATGTAGNSAAVSLVGQGSAAGLLATGGATGAGASYVGGATSGNAVAMSYTSPVGAIKGTGISESGIMQSGSTSTTAVLRSATSFADDLVIGSTLVITGGTGVGQSRSIDDWVSSSDTATVAAWTTTPDNTSTYEVWSTPPASASAATDVNVISISGDTTAADNLELFMDGTGYAGGTTKLGVNAVQVGSQTASAAGTVTFPGTIASSTNITGGTITTVTNLTNAPTAGDLTSTMKASVNAEVDTALTDIHLDHLLAADYDPASKPGVSTALLNEIIESDSGVSRFTANALETAPSGSSITDFTANERTAMFAILGIATDNATPTDPTTGILDTTRDSVATRASQTSVDDLPTNAELATSQGTADDATLAVVATLQTTADAIPTNAELATALGTADDATLAAIAALNNVSTAQVLTQVLAANNVITGTCDSGSTTTCVDNALTQAAEAQLDDRLVCYDDNWCGMSTGFTPGSDTLTHTKVAPSTRASKVYWIFPSTLQ